MIVGWAINSAMILLAAAAFFNQRLPVEELRQAKSMLEPLLGGASGVVFAVALLLAGIASSITAGMAGGSIVAAFPPSPTISGTTIPAWASGSRSWRPWGSFFLSAVPFGGLSFPRRS